ncbi:hypothetical protein AB6A40_005971 [Gnathostoma spinigerum]|uniref:Beta-catenin-interacting ICAT domain-containing protein n=1 Tax=Gnathostoma spinigerum TaxID=75299 RepID=A0ABD6ERF5_9BILA
MIMDEENRKLIVNIQDQLQRLMNQLADLEEERDSIGNEEYVEMRKDTMEQLEDLGQTLDRIQCGDMTLTDQLTATRQAIRAAISEAFKTPEIAAFFAKKQPALLRQKLNQLETDNRLHKLANDVYASRKQEILYALARLGDNLSDDEKRFLSSGRNIPSDTFELIPDHFSV